MRAAARRAFATSDYIAQTRAAKLGRRRIAAACVDDGELLGRFLQAARRALGDAVRSRDVAPPLASIFERSARGELPQLAWDQELESVAAELPPTDRASFAATRELRKALLRRIPHDSHELRLREALRSVAEGAPDEHAALSTVMEGAVACGAQSLQDELLDRFRRLARHNRVELATLVQAPLLRRLDAPEARELPALEGVPSPGVRLNDLECLLAAAELARRSDDDDHAKHGCVLIDDGGGGVLGSGFNHHVAHDGRRAIVHAEAHAVADAIRTHGERAAFGAFPTATAWIVELLGSVGYDEADPCPKCTGMLRAVGVRAARHTSATGRIVQQIFGPPLPHLLAEKSVAAPLGVILREDFGATCDRLGADVMAATIEDLRVTTARY
jgi:tRNA(Arg) A34 adenosine deaminase TadA